MNPKRQQSPIVPDPNILIGPYKVMRRTDAKGIVIDTRIGEPIKRVVAVRDNLIEAINKAKELRDGEAPR